jgi:hypothetical protein
VNFPPARWTKPKPKRRNGGHHKPEVDFFDVAAAKPLPPNRFADVHTRPPITLRFGLALNFEALVLFKRLLYLLENRADGLGGSYSEFEVFQVFYFVWHDNSFVFQVPTQVSDQVGIGC